MSENSKIEWCDATINWWAGCTKISPACDHCYAEKMAGRLFGVQWGTSQPRKQFAGAFESLRTLDRKAKRLGKKLKVFHNSLSDMFDNEVPDEWRMAAFQAMAETPNLIHLVLTKRIGNVQPYTQRDGLAFDLIGDGRVWLGATIVNQEEADRDIPKLLAVPAAKRFLSMEPLLGPVDLTTIDIDGHSEIFPLRGTDRCEDDDGNPAPDLPALDWVIAGGESGPGARPSHPDWYRSLRDQCADAGVPFLFKQWGEWANSEAAILDLNTCYDTSRIGGWVEAGGAFSQGETAAPRESNAAHVFRVGKKAAGRLLDGVEHNGFPS